MSDSAFPALGFDPAPGDPDALAQLASSWSRLGEMLGSEAGSMRSVHDGLLWQGRAASACLSRLAVVPADLDDAADGYRSAARAVAHFTDELRRLHVTARELENDAAHILAAVRAATDQATAHADRVRLTDVVQRAERLRDEAEAGATVVRRVLDEACAAAPHPPGWFHQMLHGLAADLHQVAGALHEFVVRYAPQIEALSAWCAKAASVLAEAGFVLSIVPGVGEAVGGVLVSASIGLTVIAVAGHATLAAAGEGSWRAVAFDGAALTLAVASRGLGDPIAAEAEAGAERAATLPLPWRNMPVMTEREFVLRAVRLHVDGAAAALGTVDLARISKDWPALLGRRPVAVAGG